MAAITKKVILFLVEGPTDEDALSPVLKKIFQNSQVRFHVVHGDITSDLLVDAANVLVTVNEHVKIEMDRYGFKRSDILRVIHLIDTDGAFIPNENVIAGDVNKLQYEENQIICQYPARTIARNERKTRTLNRLCSAKKAGGTPYAIYYFSRNLEHVLHDNPEGLTDDQKIDYADEFADKYAKSPDDFIQFLSNSDFTVHGSYGETWRFIFEDTHSLHRHCNLHLLFQEENHFEQ